MIKSSDKRPGGANETHSQAPKFGGNDRSVTASLPQT